jgi:hypothetical protein
METSTLLGHLEGAGAVTEVSLNQYSVSGCKVRPRWPRNNPLSVNVAPNFADKLQSFGGYSLLED